MNPINRFFISKLFYPSSMYKNKTDQKPGWDREVMKWCLREAKEKNLREQDFWGGFILDEMKVQVRTSL